MNRNVFDTVGRLFIVQYEAVSTWTLYEKIGLFIICIIGLIALQNLLHGASAILRIIGSILTLILIYFAILALSPSLVAMVTPLLKTISPVLEMFGVSAV
jgi:hypothetical protein